MRAEINEIENKKSIEKSQRNQKPLARLRKMGRINKSLILEMKEGTSLRSHGYLRIIKECYEQLYAHKFCNLDEMDQVLERPGVPKLTQEEINN